MLEVTDQVSSQPSPAGEVIDAGMRLKSMDCLSWKESFDIFCHAFQLSIHSISTNFQDPCIMQISQRETQRVLQLEEPVS